MYKIFSSLSNKYLILSFSNMLRDIEISRIAEISMALSLVVLQICAQRIFQAIIYRRRDKEKMKKPQENEQTIGYITNHS